MSRETKTYSVAVVATMSAGKSSLLNALMATDLLPSQNEACTATVFKIADYDEQQYFTGRYKKNNTWSEWVRIVNQDQLNAWNQNAPQEIEIRGNLPNISELGEQCRICFIDTPGPNNALTEAHAKITQRIINEHDFGTLLFVINSSVAGVKDEWKLLTEVKKQLARSPHSTKIIFALNKIDLLDIEKGENVKETASSIANYLESEIGYDSPILVPICGKLSWAIRQTIRTAKRLTVNQLAKLTNKKISTSKKHDLHGKKRRKSRSYLCRLPKYTQMELALLLEKFKRFGEHYEEAILGCSALEPIIDICKNNHIPTPSRKVYIHDRFYTFRELFALDALTGIPYLEKFIENQVANTISEHNPQQYEVEDNSLLQEKSNFPCFISDETRKQEEDDTSLDDEEQCNDYLTDDEFGKEEEDLQSSVLSDAEIALLPKSETSSTSRYYSHIELILPCVKDAKIACSYNNWHSSPMTKDINQGIFFVNLFLPQGKHYCKFWVDGKWITSSTMPLLKLDTDTFINTIEVTHIKENNIMLQVGIVYNPYLVTTELTIDNHKVPVNSALDIMVQDRLQNWIDKLIPAIYEEKRSKNMHITFTGTEWDIDDVVSAIEDFKKTKPDFDISITTNASRLNDEARIQKLHKLFEEGKTSPFADLFKSPEMADAFSRATDPHFEVNVIATMSSGKSTVVNALLGQELMPAKNEACTATIARIEDDDSMPEFLAQRFDKNGKPLSAVVPARKEELSGWNDDPETHRIDIKGNIPTVSQTESCTYIFVDTPGPNNSRNAAHKQATLEAIQSKPLSMVLYILNATQLSTNDDDELLNMVCKEMSRGGRKAHDRFVFVANKIDAFDPRKESVTKALNNCRSYLADHGIHNPILIPASAQLAKLLRMERAKVELTWDEMGDLYKFVGKFVNEPDMNMLEHSKGRLSTSCVRHLENKLHEAQEKKDQKTVAELLSGIPIVEEVLNDFLQKHALPAKLKDAVDSFKQIMQESALAGAMNEQLAKSEDELKQAVVAINNFTNSRENVQKAENFRNKVKVMEYALSKEAEDTCVELRNEAEKIVKELTTSLSARDISTNEAKHVVEGAFSRCQTLEAKINVELSNALKKEYYGVIEKLRTDYQQFVAGVINESFPEDSSLRELQAISMSMPSVEEIISDYSFVEEVVTGQRQEQVGVHLEDDGEETVCVGDKWEKTGEKRKKLVGTKQVKDGEEQYVAYYKTERYGFLWLKKREVPVYAWRDKYRTENIFEEEDVYELRKVFETRKKYKEVPTYITVDEKTKQEVVNLQAIRKKITEKIRTFAMQNTERFKQDASSNVTQAKNNLLALMESIDSKVKQISSQLEEANKNKATKEKLVNENRQKIEWYNGFKAKIESILAI